MPCAGPDGVNWNGSEAGNAAAVVVFAQRHSGTVPSPPPPPLTTRDNAKAR